MTPPPMAIAKCLLNSQPTEPKTPGIGYAILAEALAQKPYDLAVGCWPLTIGICPKDIFATNNIANNMNNAFNAQRQNNLNNIVKKWKLWMIYINMKMNYMIKV